MVRKCPITGRTEAGAISVENNLSSGAPQVPDSEGTQARLIGPRDIIDRISGVLVNYGFVCSGIEPERGYAEGTRYRCYLVAPVRRIGNP